MIKGAGRMGWTPDEFWFSTPSFFFAALTGHMDQELDRRYIGLEQARIVAYYAFIADDPKNRHGAIKMSDIVRLPWDVDGVDVSKFPEIAQEVYDEFSAQADRIYEQFTGQKWPLIHN